MCGYVGREIVEKCRAIRDLETDLRELLRQDREGHQRGLLTREARRVLAGDPGALAVLECVAGPDKEPWEIGLEDFRRGVGAREEARG